MWEAERDGNNMRREWLCVGLLRWFDLAIELSWLGVFWMVFGVGGSGLSGLVTAICEEARRGGEECCDARSVQALLKNSSSKAGFHYFCCAAQPMFKLR
jgi:hypothetical protein